MDCRKPFALFLLLSSLSFAADASGNFRCPFDPDGTYYRFNTDMQFTTAFTLSLVSGSVASGNPADLQAGDTVCSGAVLRATPTVTAKWAVSSLDIGAWYPNCDAYGNCPQPMIDGGSVSTNRNIKWLPAATFNSQDAFGDANSFAHVRSKYDELETFHTQPMTYKNNTGSYAGKEGEANVFCKGKVQVRDGGAPQGSPLTLPTTGNVEFTVNGTGAHPISTRLTDAACFAVAVKHPTEYVQVTAQDYFLMSYYTMNQPGVPEATATKTINVQASGGTCNMHETTVTASTSLTSEDDIMIKVAMHNDGDPIQVTGVSSSDLDYTALAFPTAACGVLGFAPSICPASNGFNEDIASGGNKNLYVWLHRSPGASGCPQLTFTAQTASSACGGASMCTEDVGLCGPFGCNITPPSLSLGTNEVAQFDVECTDISGDPVGCAGSDWYWADGLSGGFIEKTSSGAKAYTTSPPGSSGTLNYHSGIALCHSDVNAITPTYECELVPPSATLGYDESKAFDLNGFVHGSASPPDDASYDLIEGLAGSLSGESVNGVTYDAPSSDSDGKIRAFAEYGAAPDPILGAVCFSSINVKNTSGGIVEEGPGGEGSTQWCTIGSGPLSVYPGYSNWIGIMCGPHATDPCANVTWSASGGVSVSGGNDGGTSFEITGSPGDPCRINAYVNNTPDQNCYKPCYITKPECWEFT